MADVCTVSNRFMSSSSSSSPAPPSSLETSSSAITATASNPNRPRKKQIKQWRCDICKVLSFPTFEEACAHEETCRGTEHRGDTNKHSDNNDNTDDAKTIDLSQSDTSEKDSSSVSSQKTPLQRAPKQRRRRQQQQQTQAIIDLNIDDKSDDDKMNVDDTHPNNDNCSEVQVSAQHFKRRKTTNAIDLTGTTRQKKKGLPPATTANPAKKAVQSQKDKSGKKNGNHNNKDRSDVPLAAVFAMSAAGMDQQTFLQQQAQAVFRAKRLHKEQQQREKQKRKQQQKQQDFEASHTVTPFGLARKSSSTSNTAATASAAPAAVARSTAATATTKSSNLLTRSPSRIQTGKFGWAVRFPTVSHVIGDAMERQESKTVSVRIPQSMLATPSLESTCSHLILASSESSKSIALVPDRNNESRFANINDSEAAAPWDAVQYVLRSALVPPSTLSSTSSQLWTDKYAITADCIPPVPLTATKCSASFDDDDDENEEEDNDEGVRMEIEPELDVSRVDTGIVLSKSLRAAAIQMRDFVEKWKIERHKANQRAEERQRKLTKAKRVKKKQAKRRKKFGEDDELDKDDDLLWCDSDEEELARRNNLCIVTGPVGSGKTRLVHAVAQSCGCQLLELNTSQKRGAAALRKTLSEATQSHSSVEMLKKKEKSRNPFFAAKDLEDSENEEDGNEAFAAACSSTSLTLILIDEADILFEEHGDNGFWSALMDLARRAKSPIFLTANDAGLVASAIGTSCRFTHIETTRPSPTECCSILQTLIQQEGFTPKASQGSEPSWLHQQLEKFAELCDCDVRRMAHEMQLFAHFSDAKGDLNPVAFSTKVLAANNNQKQTKEHPIISCVEPRGVRAEKYELVIIRGAKFMQWASPTNADMKGYPVKVKFGDEACPAARIMNDSTILAVVPPSPLPPNVSVDAVRSYSNVHRRCYSAEYKPISLSSIRELGITSSTEGAVTVQQLPDSTRILVVEPTLSLECHFSTVTGHKDGGEPSDEEEDEFEFGAGRENKTNPAKAVEPLLNCDPLDDAKVSKLIEDAVLNWTDDIPMIEDERPSITLTESSIDVELLSHHARLASDAALLEDVGTSGIPFLSGACKGFGYEMTDAFPAFTNENSQPYVWNL